MDWDWWGITVIGGWDRPWEHPRVEPPPLYNKAPRPLNGGFTQRIELISHQLTTWLDTAWDAPPRPLAALHGTLTVTDAVWSVRDGLLTLAYRASPPLDSPCVYTPRRPWIPTCQGWIQWAPQTPPSDALIRVRSGYPCEIPITVGTPAH